VCTNYVFDADKGAQTNANKHKLALGKPLPKTAESCAAVPRQFGGATAKMVANPYSTFHKPDFCKISMPT